VNNKLYKIGHAIEFAIMHKTRVITIQSLDKTGYWIMYDKFLNSFTYPSDIMLISMNEWLEVDMTNGPRHSP
jgi:hypothetical protein